MQIVTRGWAFQSIGRMWVLHIQNHQVKKETLMKNELLLQLLLEKMEAIQKVVENLIDHVALDEFQDDWTEAKFRGQAQLILDALPFEEIRKHLKP